jgi:hypothetical protein
MSLYDAIDSLPDGMRLKYKNGRTTFLYEPSVRVIGRIDVTVRTERSRATGKPDIQSETFEGVDRAWCDAQEQVLRDLGIDPSGYTVV